MKKKMKLLHTFFIHVLSPLFYGKNDEVFYFMEKTTKCSSVQVLELPDLIPQSVILGLLMFKIDIYKAKGTKHSIDS